MGTVTVVMILVLVLIPLNDSGSINDSFEYLENRNTIMWPNVVIISIINVKQQIIKSVVTYFFLFKKKYH